MKPRPTVPRIVSLLLCLALALPSHALALRGQETRENQKALSGLEEALKSGNPDEAVSAIGTRVAQLVAPIPPSHTTLHRSPAAGLEEGQKLWAEAWKEAKKIKDVVDRAHAESQLVVALAQAGRLDEAYEKAVKLDNVHNQGSTYLPQDRALAELTSLFARAGRLNDARKVAASIPQHRPDRKEAFASLAEALAAAGRFSEAITALDKMVSDSPATPTTDQKLLHPMYRTVEALIQIARHQKDWGKTKEEYRVTIEKALQVARVSYFDRPEKACSLAVIAAATHLILEEDPTGLFKEALEVNSRIDFSYRRTVEILHEMARSGQLQLLNQILVGAPEAGQAPLLALAGNFGKAREQADKIKGGANRAIALATLGRHLDGAGKTEEAAKSFQVAFQQAQAEPYGPSKVHALLHLAHEAIAVGRTPSAVLEAARQAAVTGMDKPDRVNEGYAARDLIRIAFLQGAIGQDTRETFQSADKALKAYVLSIRRYQNKLKGAPQELQESTRQEDEVALLRIKILSAQAQVSELKANSLRQLVLDRRIGLSRLPAGLEEEGGKADRSEAGSKTIASQVAPLLIDIFKEEPAETQTQEALVQAGKEAVEPLLEIIKNEEPDQKDLRIIAIGLLGRIVEKELQLHVRDTLLEYLKKEGKVASGWHQPIELLLPPPFSVSFSTLVELVTKELESKQQPRSPEVGNAAIKALGEMARGGEIDAKNLSLKERAAVAPQVMPPHKRLASNFKTALHQIGVIDVFKKALSSPDFRNAAVKAIAGPHSEARTKVEPGTEGTAPEKPAGLEEGDVASFVRGTMGSEERKAFVKRLQDEKTLRESVIDFRATLPYGEVKVDEKAARTLWRGISSLENGNKEILTDARAIGQDRVTNSWEIKQRVKSYSNAGEAFRELLKLGLLEEFAIANLKVMEENERRISARQEALEKGKKVPKTFAYLAPVFPLTKKAKGVAEILIDPTVDSRYKQDGLIRKFIVSQTTLQPYLYELWRFIDEPSRPYDKFDPTSMSDEDTKSFVDYVTTTPSVVHELIHHVNLPVEGINPRRETISKMVASWILLKWVERNETKDPQLAKEITTSITKRLEALEKVKTKGSPRPSEAELLEALHAQLVKVGDTSDVVWGQFKPKLLQGWREGKVDIDEGKQLKTRLSNPVKKDQELLRLLREKVDLSEDSEFTELLGPEDAFPVALGWIKPSSKTDDLWGSAINMLFSYPEKFLQDKNANGEITGALKARFESILKTLSEETKEENLAWIAATLGILELLATLEPNAVDGMLAKLKDVPFGVIELDHWGERKPIDGITGWLEEILVFSRNHKVEPFGVHFLEKVGLSLMENPGEAAGRIITAIELQHNPVPLVILEQATDAGFIPHLSKAFIENAVELVPAMIARGDKHFPSSGSMVDKALGRIERVFVVWARHSKQLEKTISAKLKGMADSAEGEAKQRINRFAYSVEIAPVPDTKGNVPEKPAGLEETEAQGEAKSEEFETYVSEEEEARRLRRALNFDENWDAKKWLPMKIKESIKAEIEKGVREPIPNLDEIDLPAIEPIPDVARKKGSQEPVLIYWFVRGDQHPLKVMVSRDGQLAPPKFF